ncbi:MAG: ABC transporter permease subunit [Phycisphaerae bacterium]|nr:ABC transporter permease subunit [Phycisphaerae bacterium]
MGKIKNIISMNWLTGPIFDKELRVSSRRKRNYVTRFIYIVILILFITLIWVQTVSRYYGSATYQASRMSRAGIEITTLIIWIQFCCTQLFTLVMLSTAIGDEIYNKTLGALMTTPINSFQIVMGKLLSKLLQIFLIICISLPILAVIRVFGGVQWGFIISSFFINITTVIFIGSLTIFFSIFSRKSYVVIIFTLLSMGAIFLLFPLAVGFLTDWTNDDAILKPLFYANPYVVLGANTEGMMSSRQWLSFSTAIHCVFMLTASAVVLTFVVTQVRKVALRQITGQAIFAKKPSKKNAKDFAGQKITDIPIGKIKKSPVLWRELRNSVFRRHKKLSIIFGSLLLLIIAIVYLVCASENGFRDNDTHKVFSCIYFALALLFTIVLPATCITTEKEARSWPILLATTLSSHQILWGKIIGVVKRISITWVLLFAHVGVFVFLNNIHWLALFMLGIISFGITALFTGSGLYFSSRFKKSTTAVIMNFVLGIILFAAIPFILYISLELSNSSDDLADTYCNSIPFVQVVMAIAHTTKYNSSTLIDRYWPSGELHAFDGLAVMVFFMFVNCILGMIMALIAKRNFRKRIF